ncbi:MAG: serine/threonine protein kinase, partial [Blastocatellia bacterium]
HGGFGITYIGWDTRLKLRVAIKEYLPSSLATREPASGLVTAYGIDTRELFEYGLQKYKEEARALAKFNEHPGIVSVLNFIAANGTGYIVMSYMDGITLKDFLARRGGRITFDEALGIAMPIMDSLREVHAANMLHRDISPDNIFLTSENRIKVLDFGAARYATSERSQNLSVILKPGYAPEEQYRTNGKQGPWTDVYALAATVYRAIAGTAPPDSPDRLERDEIGWPSLMGAAIPREAEAALMKALAVRAADRFPDIGSFQRAISIQRVERLQQSGGSPLGWIAATIILTLAVLATAAGWVHTGQAGKDAGQRLRTVQIENDGLRQTIAHDRSVDDTLTQKYSGRQAGITNLRFRNEVSSSPIGGYASVFN